MAKGLRFEKGLYLFLFAAPMCGLLAYKTVLYQQYVSPRPREVGALPSPGYLERVFELLDAVDPAAPDRQSYSPAAVSEVARAMRRDSWNYAADDVRYPVIMRRDEEGKVVIAYHAREGAWDATDAEFQEALTCPPYGYLSSLCDVTAVARLSFWLTDRKGSATIGYVWGNENAQVGASLKTAYISAISSDSLVLAGLSETPFAQDPLYDSSLVLVLLGTLVFSFLFVWPAHPVVALCSIDPDPARFRCILLPAVGWFAAIYPIVVYNHHVDFRSILQIEEAAEQTATHTVYLLFAVLGISAVQSAACRCPSFLYVARLGSMYAVAFAGLSVIFQVPRLSNELDHSLRMQCAMNYLLELGMSTMLIFAAAVSIYVILTRELPKREPTSGVGGATVLAKAARRGTPRHSVSLRVGGSAESARRRA